MVGGVYQIRCRATGKVYIGSSMNVAGRLDQHMSLLRRRRHHSPKLQNAYNKYGDEEFDYDLVDPVYSDSSDDLKAAETKYIHKLDSFHNGYNCTTRTGKGGSVSSSERTKMSASAKRVGQDPVLRKKRSDNARAQHAAGNLGQKTWLAGTNKVVGDKIRGRKRPDFSKLLMGNQYARKKPKS